MEGQVGVCDFLRRCMPYIAMILLQIGYAGINILAKMSLNDGMSHYVFVVYRHAFATLSIAPFALILERNVRPKMTFGIFLHIFVLALLGPAIDQNLYFAGLKFTSPTFACAMSNILPAMTFIMALIFRMEKMDIKKVIYQVKVAGTLVSVAGAMLMTLYKGPIVEMFWTKHMHPHKANGANAAAETSDKNWLIGSIFLVIATLAWASLFILQVATLKKYSAHLSLTALICLVGTMLDIVLTFVMEHKTSVWSIGWDINLLAAAYGGIVTTSISYYVQGLVIQKRGPVFGSAFSPLMMIVVAIMGSFVLAEKIYLGSILGSVLIVAGLYSVLWGKYKENKEKKEKEAMSLPDVVKGIDVMDTIELEKVNAKKMMPCPLDEVVIEATIPITNVAMESREEVKA